MTEAIPLILMAFTALFYFLCLRAPEGYQDKAGWHRGREG
jgi:hypothetical protein